MKRANNKVPSEPDIESMPLDITASDLVHNFLLQNKISPKITVVSELNAWVGDGFILHDKPLLKITYEYNKE